MSKLTGQGPAAETVAAGRYRAARMPLRAGSVAAALAVAAGLGVAPAAAAAPAAKPPNVSGTWAPRIWTPVRIRFQQRGDDVVGVGVDLQKDIHVRGRWDGGRLVLVTNRFDAGRKRCRPEGTFVLSGTNLTSLDSHWERSPQRPVKGPWLRESPNAGPPIEYPYALELELCGQLRTYELAFASGSDQLLGTDWPILGALAELLKNEPSTRIQVSGHTDSTGDAAKNEALSERRAAAVKQVLVDKYSVDEGQVETQGFGADQPVVANDTPENRALNRRVEIVRAN